MIFAIAALSLDLILGYGGLVSFGHAVYLGIGEAACDAACDYANNRIPSALGKPIAAQPHIQHWIGQMQVVVVTTPQKLAQDVAARAAAMAQKTNMRLLGVIENMSGDVFGSGGGEELADELGVSLLGTVPLDPALREQGDAGVPVVSAQPDAESARAIVAIAQEIEELRRETGSGIVKSLPLVG